MGVLKTLKFQDMAESASGFASLYRTLGPVQGTRAIYFAATRQFRAMKEGQGNYPEQGKRRIWFKFHFLKNILEFLENLDEKTALEKFEKILEAPGIAYIGGFIPPSKMLTRDKVLNQVWNHLN